MCWTKNCPPRPERPGPRHGDAPVRNLRIEVDICPKLEEVCGDNLRRRRSYASLPGWLRDFQDTASSLTRCSLHRVSCNAWCGVWLFSPTSHQRHRIQTMASSKIGQVHHRSELRHNPSFEATSNSGPPHAGKAGFAHSALPARVVPLSAAPHFELQGHP